MMKLLLGLLRYLSSVQLLSCVQLFATPWTAARQASLSITNSWSLSLYIKNKKGWKFNLWILYFKNLKKKKQQQ